jgi:hypothetical protein
VTIEALVRDIVDGDQMGVGVDRDLGVVADEPAAPGLVAIARASGSISEIGPSGASAKVSSMTFRR